MLRVLLLLCPQSSCSWWCVGVCEGFILSPLNHGSTTSFQPFCTSRKEPCVISPRLLAEGGTQQPPDNGLHPAGCQHTLPGPTAPHGGRDTPKQSFLHHSQPSALCTHPVPISKIKPILQLLLWAKPLSAVAAFPSDPHINCFLRKVSKFSNDMVSFLVL